MAALAPPGLPAEVDAALDGYRFADAAQALHRFTWSEFCDWGLELQKGRLEGDDQERADAAAVLAWVLERTLRLLHPTMPFVTEEIWQRFGAGESIAIAAWPEPRPDHADAGAEALVRARPGRRDGGAAVPGAAPPVPSEAAARGHGGRARPRTSRRSRELGRRGSDG